MPKASEIVRQVSKLRNINFRVITLREPPKDKLVSYLDAEHRGDEPPALDRCARAEILVQGSTGSNDLIELILDLERKTIVKQQHLIGKHSYIDTTYMKAVENACLSNPQIKESVYKLDLPDGATPIVEPWAYATDGENDMSSRITMVSPPCPSSHQVVPPDSHNSAGSTSA